MYQDEEIKKLHDELAAMHTKVGELTKRLEEAEAYAPPELGVIANFRDRGEAYVIGDSVGYSPTECNATPCKCLLAFSTKERAEKAQPLMEELRDIIEIACGTPSLDFSGKAHEICDAVGGGFFVSTFYNPSTTMRENGAAFTPKQLPLAEKIAEFMNKVLKLRPKV